MSPVSKDDSWLRAALEGADLAAWVWDVPSDRVKLSESWMAILGEERREVTVERRELASLVHPDDLPRLLSVLDAVRRGRTSAYDVEHRVRVAGGGYRWIESCGKVIERDAAGQPLTVTGTNADITARRRAEEMLAARELQLRLISDSLPAMIVELDEQDRIRYCNSKFAEHSGKSMQSLIGRTLAEAMDQGAVERFAEHRGRIRAGQPVTYERVQVRPDKPEAQLLIRIVPRMERGNYAGCYMMAEDITERRRLETMKEQFVRTVSHELRTPLKAIGASLDRIAAGGTAAELAELVASARSSCERLVRLVSDILDYQRLRAGHSLPGASAPLQLAAQVREAVAATESLAREAGVTLRVTAPDAPVPVTAVADRVTQLVTNLVANALKHSARGDTVEISVARSGDQGRVSVRDRGPGVPADFRPQLFQQFAQADEGRKRGGTGLGLAICKAIAEQMNGRVGFEPAQGAGAVFWFELPLA